MADEYVDAPLWEPTYEELAQMYMAAIEPTPPPGFLDRLAMGLQGIHGPTWGSGALLAGLGQGFAGARMGTMQRGDMERARKNQANLEATRAHITNQLRTKPRTTAQIERDAAALARGTRRGQIEAGPLPEATKPDNSGDPVLSASDVARFRLPLEMTGKRISQLSPSDRARVAPRENFAAQRFGVSTAATIRHDIKNDPDISDFIVVRDNYERVKAGAQSRTGIGDLAMIFAYMKVLDPTSVVRETEYKNAAEAIGRIEVLKSIPKQWIQGDKLTQEGREGFLAEIERLYDAKLASHQEAVTFYTELARSSGIDPKLVLRDFTAPSRKSSTVRMVAPDGRVLNVPQDKVKEAEARGARRQ